MEGPVGSKLMRVELILEKRCNERLADGTQLLDVPGVAHRGAWSVF